MRRSCKHKVSINIVKTNNLNFSIYLGERSELSGGCSEEPTSFSGNPKI